MIGSGNGSRSVRDRFEIGSGSKSSKSLKTEWGQSTDVCLPRDNLGGRKSRFNATKCCSSGSGFLFPLTVMPHAHSFFSCFTSSHVEIPRACASPNDGRAASLCASALPCRPLAISSVPVIPSTLSILAPISLPHPAILRSLHSCRTSCLRVRYLLRKTRSVPSRLFRLLLSSFFTPSP